jgi:phage N-6-adenine-methyltransferase
MAHKRNGTIATPKDEWGTPDHIFNKLNEEFHFDLDAAANCNNAKCELYFDKHLDALQQNWCKYARGGNIWLNPPYSKGNVERFMQKAYEESEKGFGAVVCIVPVDFSTNWWHDYVMNAYEIRAIKGRVKFIGYDDNGDLVKNSPTFSSCIVIFKKALNPLHKKSVTLTVF